jgi:periplasmic protein TonB
VVVPQRPFDIDQPSNPVDATDQQQDYTRPDTTATGSEGLGDGLSDNSGKAKDPPKLFDPVPPKARNGNWVTDNDYRTAWINRAWEGTAAFRLTIGTDGRVKDCTITQSTGHDALDDATCTLVTRRAKFDPAKNDQGQTVSGSFSSAVRWQIPE